MRLLKNVILPRISVPFSPKEVAFQIMLHLALRLRVSEMHHVTYIYRPCVHQNGVKCEKEENNYIQSHSAVLRHNLS